MTANRLAQTGDVMARIGILNGGGDCPGLNAVIRAVVRKGTERYGAEIVGFRDGYQGVLDGAVKELSPESVRGILHRGGTILGTSRVNPFRMPDGLDRVRETLHALGIEGLIVIGGEGTMGTAAKLAAEGVNVVGVPKTIDNDLAGTDVTFGFDTAVQVATDAIDRLHTTAESHNRVMVVEVMGRQTGWIALHSGLAGGADVILIPEQPITVEEACDELERRHQRGKDFSIVVVSEGYELTYASGERRGIGQEAAASDQFGHIRLGGVGD